MKISRVIAVGTVLLLSVGVALAQDGNMMNGGAWGGWMGGYGMGYGGIWVPILLVIAVAGVVAWIVKQNNK